jgi:hypothetical protein
MTISTAIKTAINAASANTTFRRIRIAVLVTETRAADHFAIAFSMRFMAPGSASSDAHHSSPAAGARRQPIKHP